MGGSAPAARHASASKPSEKGKPNRKRTNVALLAPMRWTRSCCTALRRVWLAAAVNVKAAQSQGGGLMCATLWGLEQGDGRRVATAPHQPRCLAFHQRI